jgi:hypothetical protein
LISFQIDLVPLQYRVVNHQDLLLLFLPRATSSSWAYYSSLGPWPKLEHAPRRWGTHQGIPWTSFPLATSLWGQQGHPSQVGPNPCQVRVHLGLQEQSVVKRMPRSHTDSIFDDPHMDGKIIS